MAIQAELMLTRFFPIFALLQAYFFFKTIWDKKSNDNTMHLYMALLILLIIGTNTYALYQLRENTHNSIPIARHSIQIEANIYMTVITSIAFIVLILISKSNNYKNIERGIALIILIFTLINVGFSLQSFGNSFI